MVPERLPHTLIVHWFAPPQVLPLIEVVQGERPAGSGDPHHGASGGAEQKAGADQKYVPGFIINRLLRILGRETYFLLDNGYVTPEDLDMAVKASIAPRMMVLGLTQRYDFTGLDLTYANLHNEEFVDARRTRSRSSSFPGSRKTIWGIKTGIGVYDYRDRDKADVIKDRDRYLLRVVNSLQFCLEKKRLF
jgi:3-hydroxybutyryl-CoA dehydrogenase